MRNILPVGVAAMVLALGPAYAQTATPMATDQAPAARHAPAKPMRGLSARQQRAVEAGMEADGAAPPTSAYRGGAGSPYSTTATNIGGSRTEIGSRLPAPDAAANTPEALLASAQRALAAGKTGAAQEALEQAETRALTRTIDPSMAGQPDTASMVREIGAARQALGRRDMAGARAAIQAAMSAPTPPPGPATTTVPGTYR